MDVYVAGLKGWIEDLSAKNKSLDKDIETLKTTGTHLRKQLEQEKELLKLLEKENNQLKQQNGALKLLEQENSNLKQENESLKLLEQDNNHLKQQMESLKLLDQENKQLRQQNDSMKLLEQENNNLKQENESLKLLEQDNNRLKQQNESLKLLEQENIQLNQQNESLKLLEKESKQLKLENKSLNLKISELKNEHEIIDVSSDSEYEVNEQSNQENRRRIDCGEKDMDGAPQGQSGQSESPPRQNNSLEKRVVVEAGGLDEIEAKYIPSEWLSEVMPRRTPYYPQLGDELVYLRQGHEMYVSEVNAHSIYPMSKKDIKNLPWNLKPYLRPELSVRVVSIKFELKPPRLVNLKLAVTDWDTGELTGTIINNVVYHDLHDVVDFLVLRQHYNKSMRHKWNINDRFRCLIYKEWWLGTIQSIEHFNPQFPDSKFMCYKVLWDNKDEERMSPWDIEIIRDDFEIPKGTKGESGFPASYADLRSRMYEVNERDWPPHGDQNAECTRIETMLDRVMCLAIAEPFLTPVDLNAYPMYAYDVEYPIDLATIKSRLENHFYRRLDAVKFDIKFIAQNAEKFNQPRSDIVKQARIIRDICLRVMSQPGATEVTTAYHNLMKNFTWSDSDEELKQKTARRKSKALGLSYSRSTRAEPVQGPSESSKPWEERCKDLFTKIWNSRDSTPFREPVDIIEYPDYHQQIDTPMDLQIVKENLLGNNYESPQAFTKDMQLMFLNSRIYNADKHSQIHMMTIRLQALFECQMRQILGDCKLRRPDGQRSFKPRTRGSRDSSSEPVAEEDDYRDKRSRRKRPVSAPSPGASAVKKMRMFNGSSGFSQVADPSPSCALK